MKKKKKNQFGSFLLKKFQTSRLKRPLPRRKLSLREMTSPVSRSLKLSQFQRSSELEKKTKKQRKQDGSDLKGSPQEITPPSSQQLTLEFQAPAAQPESQTSVKVVEPEVLTQSEQPSEITTYDLIKPKDRLKDSIEGFLLDQRSEHTRKAYGKDIKRFLKFLHARNLAYGVGAMNRTILIAYKESLLTEGLEHTSVDRHMATMKSFFKWLMEDGLISKSPAEGVRFMNPKRLSTTIGFSDEEVKKLLAVPDLHTRVGSLHYAVLMVLFYCGLRRSEVCGLRTSSIGTERNQYVIRLRGKGNAERIIVMIPPVWSALKHYFYITQRKMSEDAPLFKPIKNNRNGITNKPLDPSMIFYIVTKYARQAGIANRVSPHSCRATAISNARDHNVPDRAIQEFAGWASPDMITRYDKRKSAIENSAAFSIIYGAENRSIPVSPEMPLTESTQDQEQKELLKNFGELEVQPQPTPQTQSSDTQQTPNQADSESHMQQKIAELVKELNS